MKRLPFSRLPPRDRLQVAITINLLATPGLGTWIAGRRRTGLLQVVVACTGFVLFLAYLVLLVTRAWQGISLGIEPAPPPPRLLQSGLAVFGLSWLWAAWTSLGLWRESRRLPQTSGEPPTLP